MPAANVRFPLPLVRQNPWFPGQLGGVPGVDNETGLRTHPTGTVFYVDPNHVDAHDQRDGTDPNAPLATVAAALSKCQDYHGDVIVVGANDAWQYGEGVNYATPITENVEVTVHGVRIIGVSPSGALGVCWMPSDVGQVLITVSAMDVLIEGFCFMGSTYGGTAIYAEWDGATLFGENLTVRHCFFDDDIDIAIQLEYAWNNEIHDCIFQECDTYGIYVDPAGSGASDNRIHDNWFQDCGAAMALQGCVDSVIYRNFIYNSNAQGAALATDEGIDTTGGARNLVFDNWFSCLLPVPANGDWNDLNTSAATDAWVGNHCMDGLAVANP